MFAVFNVRVLDKVNNYICQPLRQDLSAERRVPVVDGQPGEIKSDAKWAWWGVRRWSVGNGAKELILYPVDPFQNRN